MPRIGAGDLDRRVTFTRRQKVAAQAGNARGEYVDYITRWAAFRDIGVRARAEQVVAGLVEDAIDGTLYVRQDSGTRTLTSADRVRIGEAEYAIVSVPPHDRSGFLVISVRRSTAN